MDVESAERSAMAGINPTPNHLRNSIRHHHVFCPISSTPAPPVSMANWDDLPPELHVAILRAFCNDIVTRYNAFLDKFTPLVGDIIADEKPFGIESPVPVFPINALLTSKSFYLIITSLKFDGITFIETLQRHQKKMLYIFLDDGCSAPEAPTTIVRQFSKTFGCFWKNAAYLRDLDPLEFIGAPASRTFLVCVMEDWILERAKPVSAEYANEGIVPLVVNVQFELFRIDLQPGHSIIEGDAIIQSVAGYTPRRRKYVELDGTRKDISESWEQFRTRHYMDRTITNLPMDFSDNKWWVMFGCIDTTDWILINYEEKLVIEGGEHMINRAFANACAEFGFTAMSWLKIPLEVTLLCSSTN
jgi:hypothetical protein